MRSCAKLNLDAENSASQAQIGERIGWSREQVKDYATVLNKICADVLDLAKKYQVGRAPKNGANAPNHDFTEGWFRASGLYELHEYPHRQ
ncbi:hypothetical protein SPSYN_02011 [Sporotomaculum syntrophicum]|uniref:Uncharacterized protein n=1 Tax=Sporotomaculum syntrophicum TaxID=182264 RepID=A0A9D2WQ31_9FIRM|nr:hypothetical protein [Sporotomaculum syntrophicum]KAF1084841.1 hypothetical protein SPSYN_02011 [Sporotomaculum syntrophicum]